MKKIRRKPSEFESRFNHLVGINTLLNAYIQDRGLMPDLKAYVAEIKGGDGNGLQGNGKEGREDANEGKGDDGCGCGEGSCCKEGKEEVNG